MKGGQSATRRSSSGPRSTSPDIPRIACSVRDALISEEPEEPQSPANVAASGARGPVHPSDIKSILRFIDAGGSCAIGWVNLPRAPRSKVAVHRGARRCSVYPTIKSGEGQSAHHRTSHAPKAHMPPRLPQGSSAPSMTGPRGSHALSSSRIGLKRIERAGMRLFSRRPEDPGLKNWLTSPIPGLNVRWAQCSTRCISFPKWPTIRVARRSQGLLSFAIARAATAHGVWRHGRFGPQGPRTCTLRTLDAARDTDWVRSPERHGTNGRNRCGLTSTYWRQSR